MGLLPLLVLAALDRKSGDETPSERDGVRPDDIPLTLFIDVIGLVVELTDRFDDTPPFADNLIVVF
jgi:hypothetical protein